MYIGVSVLVWGGLWKRSGRVEAQAGLLLDSGVKWDAKREASAPFSHPFRHMPKQESSTSSGWDQCFLFRLSDVAEVVIIHKTI